jgi:vancomycin resistance protein YoaR
MFISYNLIVFTFYVYETFVNKRRVKIEITSSIFWYNNIGGGIVIMRKRKNKSNKIFIGIIISFCVLLVLYFGITMYFRNHFYFGSTISCVNVSGKTVEEVDEQMIEEVEEYKLEVEERGNIKEEIKGSDIDLKYNSRGKVDELKEKQNPFGWIIGIFDKKDTNIEEVVTYDEKLLQEVLGKLSSLDNNNIVEPQNPSFQYKDDGYVVVEEVNGNKINRDILYDSVVNAILKGEKTIDLEVSGCYEKPKYILESQEIIDTRDILNKYIGSVITYTFGDKRAVLNGAITNDWLKVDENLQITFDEEKMKSYLDKLSSTYDTVGKARDFATSLKTIKKVSGGDYGWQINKNEEMKELIKAIKEGEKITKEPIYIQTALSRENNDIGNTYVEINMSKQHLWFYKNGVIVVEGDVVTGNVNNNCSTPTGIYKLKYKQKDATLKGDNYATQVSFWMPFNGGIGIHDANWRYEFGRNIYMTNGSHGCVNAPYYLANGIFDNIEAGTPIICYYE